MLLGKFLPPHAGHVFLGNFAQHFVDELSIVVGTLNTEPIDGDLRFAWMKELFPNAKVVHLKKDLPQEPSEHPDFWNIWRTELQNILPNPPEVVFASENYGHRLAKELGARFIPVDPKRENRQISATMIRQDPMQHWDLIPEPVRPYFVKRISVFGPESTGKSTLTQNLAKHVNTVGVTEYARTFIEAFGGDNLGPQNMRDIARGQVASEDALARVANKMLFTDTDPLATPIWNDFLFQHTDTEIERLADARHYDLTLLCDVAVPWINDEVRYLPKERQSLLARCDQELQQQGRNYLRISGDWETRTKTAIEAVVHLLGH